MNQEAIYQEIKSAFCNLVNWKQRGNTLEIITPLVTADNKFVSVFITEKKSGLIVTDGGWIDNKFYGDLYVSEPDDMIAERVTAQLTSSFGIEKFKSLAGENYYYKRSSTKTIANDCFDVANFISQAINSGKLRYNDEKEVQEKNRFRKMADDFLISKYSKRVTPKFRFDDIPSIKFNTAITNGSGLYLINYITGSTPFSFANDLRKCIVNFEMVMRTKYRVMVKERLALINDEAPGFNTEQSLVMYELLKAHSSRDIIPWKKKDEILEIIS